jgi:hypothetical protein
MSFGHHGLGALGRELILLNGVLGGRGRNPGIVAGDTAPEQPEAVEPELDWHAQRPWVGITIASFGL